MKNPEKPSKFAAPTRRLRRTPLNRKPSGEVDISMRMDGRFTLQEIIDHLEQIAPGTDLSEFDMYFSHVRWTSQATEFEKAEALDQLAAQEAKKAEWERKQLLILLDKHGVPEDYEPPTFPLSGEEKAS